MAEDEKTRRDFIYIATGAVAAGGVAMAAWPMIAHMGMAADVPRGQDIDVSDLEEGQQLKLAWRGKPVFIRHRTPAEITAAKAGDTDALRHPETDRQRLRVLPNGEPNERFLVLIGVCTHFGCIPVGVNGGFNGDYGGWYCPCHAAHFDTSGRTRKGPAPTNMVIPPYKWLSETKLTLYHHAKDA